MEGPFCWVPGPCAAAGLLEALLLKLVRPLRLWLLLRFCLGGCFRRTWVRPHDEGPHLLQQPLHGGVVATFGPRYRDDWRQGFFRPIHRRLPLHFGSNLPVLGHGPQNDASSD